MKKEYVIIILIFVITGLGLFYYLLNSGPNRQAATDEMDIARVSSTPTSTPFPSPEIPEDWKVREYSDLGISFATPSDFEIDENDGNNVIAIPTRSRDLVGNTRFFYVSVVPAHANTEAGVIYNYDPIAHKKLAEANVNDRINLSDNAGQEEWFTYERYDDDNFNGKVAKVFVNQRPWEFPNGTWEYRYIFELPGKTVIAGAYIDGGPSDAYFTLPFLTQIMNTLVIQ